MPEPDFINQIITNPLATKKNWVRPNERKRKKRFS